MFPPDLASERQAQLTYTPRPQGVGFFAVCCPPAGGRPKSTLHSHKTLAGVGPTAVEGLMVLGCSTEPGAAVMLRFFLAGLVATVSLTVCPM